MWDGCVMVDVGWVCYGGWVCCGGCGMDVLLKEDVGVMVDGSVKVDVGCVC